MAVVRASNDAATKKVPKKIAVEEEEFNEAITDIVRRDFFPDLQESAEDDATKNTTHQLRLDQYLNKYESEDDASFSNMLEKASEIHHKEHAWLHEKEEEYQKLAMEQKLSIGEGKRKAGLDSWTYTAKNTLMYVPDGVECSAVEAVKGATKMREIVHSNTRLSQQFVKKQQLLINVNQPQRPPQDKIGIDGKIASGEESPKVNGYGFVATPIIHPGVDASPLMTWGSIDGTPLRLDSDSVTPTGPSFKMPKVPAREMVALKLADQVAKANREKRKKSTSVTSPLLRERLGTTPSKSDRLRLLSPAARKLITRGRTFSDKALNASYSSPLVSGVSTPDSRSRPKLTPSHTPSLTDNLLIKKL